MWVLKVLTRAQIPTAAEGTSGGRVACKTIHVQVRKPCSDWFTLEKGRISGRSTIILPTHLPVPCQKGRKDQQKSAQLTSSWFHCQPTPAKSACKHQVQHHAPTAGHTFHLSLFPTIPTASLVYKQVEPPQKKKKKFFWSKICCFLDSTTSNNT